MDCYDSQVHANNIYLNGASNTSATAYRRIQSSSGCTTPWAGKEGTGATFLNTAAATCFSIGESYGLVKNIAAKNDPNGNAVYSIFAHSTSLTGVKFINCVAYDGVNTNYPARAVNGFTLSYSNAADGHNLAFGCIAKGNTGYGFQLRGLNASEYCAAVCCTALENGGLGFDSYGSGGKVIFWSCYGANNTGGDFDEANTDAPSGWNASKDTTADLGGVAGDNYKNSIDLITAGKMDSDGLALDDDLFANGVAGDRYGRNPYDDLSASIDFGDFLKNDAAGNNLSKKDIRGTDRPTPDTADVSWNVGASELLLVSTTAIPTTIAATTLAPTTLAPTTLLPTTLAPTTLAPTTLLPTTLAPVMPILIGGKLINNSILFGRLVQ